MMDAINVNINVNNYALYVKMEYVKNVINLDGKLKIINVFHIVVMGY